MLLNDLFEDYSGVGGKTLSTGSGGGSKKFRPDGCPRTSAVICDDKDEEDLECTKNDPCGYCKKCKERGTLKVSESDDQETLRPPSISKGDEVKVGKFKNSKATVKGFKKDDHNQPVLKTTKGDKKLFNLRLSKLQEDDSPFISDAVFQALDDFADKMFGKVGIDVRFTYHFMKRVNDERNERQITIAELIRLFKQEAKRWGKPIAAMNDNSEAVMRDMQTDINLPFVLNWNERDQEMELVAKTIMRKKDFKTDDPTFPIN